ncbi:MAG: hypothetical protein EAZ10_18065, partial [Oscillatoriales cyanobacterium]
DAIAPRCSNSVMVRSAIDRTFAQTKSVTYPLLSNSAPSAASVVKKIIHKSRLRYGVSQPSI